MSRRFGAPRHRGTRVASPVLLATLLAAGHTRAEEPERAREAELFGAPAGEASREAELFGEPVATASTATTAGDGRQPVGSGAAEVRPRERAGPGGVEADLFGGTADSEPGGVTSRAPLEVAERLAEADDLLDLGGLLYLRFEYDLVDGGAVDQGPLLSPNLLDVYLDARPTDRLRAYAQARLYYDPTVTTATAAATAGGAGSTLLGYSREPLDVVLDQLWLKLDVERVVFITVGRQRIKWGAGRTWNPTDFLNQDKRNPLDIFDARTGVNLVKVHVPVEKLGWNFYLLGSLDGADRLDQLGGAARAEVVLGEMELSASIALRQDRPLRLGLDLSAAVWDFDVHAELGLQRDVRTTFWRGTLDFSRLIVPEAYSRAEDWIPQLVLGADLEVQLSEEDTIILGAEYFFNDAGYSDESLYPWLIYRGDFTPFYTGRHYASLFALLAGPGSWNDTTFLLAGIANLSDGSMVIRLDHQVRVLTQLSVNLFTMIHAGSEGELRFGLDVPPVPFVPGLEQGLRVAPPLFEVGGGLRLEL